MIRIPLVAIQLLAIESVLKRCYLFGQHMYDGLYFAIPCCGNQVVVTDKSWRTALCILSIFVTSHREFYLNCRYLHHHMLLGQILSHIQKWRFMGVTFLLALFNSEYYTSIMFVLGGLYRCPCA